MSIKHDDDLLAMRRAGETLVDAAVRLGITRAAVRQRENELLWREIRKRLPETGGAK